MKGTKIRTEDGRNDGVLRIDWIESIRKAEKMQATDGTCVSMGSCGGQETTTQTGLGWGDCEARESPESPLAPTSFFLCPFALSSVFS